MSLLSESLLAEDFPQKVDDLLQQDLDEPTFITELADLMAEACDATAHWILLAEDASVEVLTDDDSDFIAYQTVAKRHPDFQAACDLAVDEQRTVNLLLTSPRTSGLPDQAARNTKEPIELAALRETDGYAILVPLRCSLKSDMLLCFYCETFPEIDVQSLSEQLTLLAMMGAMQNDAAQLQTDMQAAENQAQEAQQANTELHQALQLGTAASTTLEKEKFGFVLANQLQKFLQVDRVTVLEQMGRQSRLLAVSGQVAFNKRANVVRCTQKLAKVALQSGESLWFDGDQEQLAPPVQEVVQNYLDESLVQSFALIPIHESQAPVYPSEEQSLVELVNPGRTEKQTLRGAILVESLQQPLEKESILPRWQQVETQVANHFNNARRYSNIFLLPLMLVLTRFAALYRGHTARIAWGLTLGLVGLIAAGLIVQDDFRVRCEGYLQPKTMHHVFVRKDGIVMEILVKEGQAVQVGEPLVNLQNKDLELELASLRGELNEKRQLHKNLTYKRLDYVNNDAAKAVDGDYQDLAEQTAVVESQIRSIEKNLQLKQQQHADLVIRAPFDGQVMGWNVDRKFLNRPLDQGTRLFSIAEVSDQRILELKVPDQRSGYVANAWHGGQADKERLQVEFSIASYPNRRFVAEVTHINPGLEQDSDLGYVLPVEACPSEELPPNLRVGIPVIAKVNCGRRSYLYCKSYEFLDWMRRTTFEYFL